LTSQLMIWICQPMSLTRFAHLPTVICYMQLFVTTAG